MTKDSGYTNDCTKTSISWESADEQKGINTDLASKGNGKVEGSIVNKANAEATAVAMGSKSKGKVNKSIFNVDETYNY